MPLTIAPPLSQCLSQWHTHLYLLSPSLPPLSRCKQCSTGTFQPEFGADHCLMVTADGEESKVLSTELVAVQKNLTLEMDANQYNETEVRIRLAELYGIAPERISLDMSAGSVQLVVTFLPSASSGTDGCGKQLERRRLAPGADERSGGTFALACSLPCRILTRTPFSLVFTLSPSSGRLRLKPERGTGCNKPLHGSKCQNVGTIAPKSAVQTVITVSPARQHQ